MAYTKRWKPSVSQRKAFAERMTDPVEQAAYEQRKKDKADKRRAGSRFDYHTAGGKYVPTSDQHSFCCSHNWSDATPEQITARDRVMFGFSCNEKVHHDYIHIINELRRAVI